MNKVREWGLLLAPLFFISCSVTAIRPTQEMSDMEVSLRAAKEVNADVLAPELYRMANETSMVAHREYRFKNFQAAKKYADQARGYAERAEFEALRNGAKREVIPEDPLAIPSYSPEPIGPPSNEPPAEGAPAPAASPGATTPSVNVPPPPTN